MSFLSINKKVFLLPVLLAVFAFMDFKKPVTPKEAIKWVSFDEAVKLNQAHPKKIFIDVYTNWCGWCKRMDASTYMDPSVISYVNQNFYAVRLNAETTDTFHFNNHVFINAKAGERGAVNELAYSLLDGKMAYPTTVYMDESFNRLSVAPGYLDVNDMKVILTYFAENKYKTVSYEDYKQAMQGAQKSTN